MQTNAFRGKSCVEAKEILKRFLSAVESTHISQRSDKHYSTFIKEHHKVPRYFQ